jgi:glycine dehydrogenase
MVSPASLQKLNYDPKALPRELTRHYISATDEEIDQMLAALGMENLDDLFGHIPADNLFPEAPALPSEMAYDDLVDHLIALARKNKQGPSYIGDGLADYTVPEETVQFVLNLRGLTTAYTPYQPERSQGTLIGHWLYQNAMAQLTGFEAINTSLYDRAMATYEAITTAFRLAKKDSGIALVSDGLYPGDREVIETLASDTSFTIISLPLNPQTGRTDPVAAKALLLEHGAQVGAFVFPQVNSLGLIEDVDALTVLAEDSGVASIAVIDPLLLAPGGLKTPATFGRKGVTIIAGEAQHLAIPPTFGGPGLGVFGVRHHEGNTQAIRVTPGRFVGKALDRAGRDCRVAVLSTREQHIRKEKATSNVCSNQAFLATLAGAAILARGDQGLAKQIKAAHESAVLAVDRLTRIPGVVLAFPETPHFSEVTFRVPQGAAARILERGEAIGVLPGVDVSDRIGAPSGSLLKVSFSDKPVAWNLLEKAFRQGLAEAATCEAAPAPLALPTDLLRTDSPGIPAYPREELHAYYQKLADLNVSPDQGIYPLGSCTMKYNPYINDWAAGLDGFRFIHPQAPSSWTQGCLEILYETEQWLCQITGLAGLTTQPVAGAQGELVGVKMIQAYHRDRGEAYRDVIFIPASAHGTNFATAAMAGLVGGKNEKGETRGIIFLKSSPNGEIDFEDFEAKLAEFGPRLSAIMVTNPNTCGIFEARFKELADKVHDAGGLVYMDGANMNAIASWVNLGAIGVDAVHNNLHKTWTIPHGGGGPGDAIVAVSHRLVDYLPGHNVVKAEDGSFKAVRAPKSIGSFHRHWGNFGHKIRCYTYLRRLGSEGVRRMAAVAVLSARYLLKELRDTAPTLPPVDLASPRMHEFILTLEAEDFAVCEKVGVAKASVIPSMGKLFLDLGYHAPTVAWPEPFGLMFEPTESFSKAELDRFVAAVKAVYHLVRTAPELLKTAPHFTPVDRIDEVGANRQLEVFTGVGTLPPLHENREDPLALLKAPVDNLVTRLKDLVLFPAA